MKLSRAEILKTLIEGTLPIELLEENMRQFAFDSQPLVTLFASDVDRMLNRFIEGTLDQDYLERWAELIEVRDDIEFETRQEDTIKEVIYDLSNPVLAGPLDVAQAQRLRALLMKSEQH